MFVQFNQSELISSSFQNIHTITVVRNRITIKTGLRVDNAQSTATRQESRWGERGLTLLVEIESGIEAEAGVYVLPLLGVVLAVSRI